MKKLITGIGIALSLSGGLAFVAPAQAEPTFGDGLNQVFFNNYENIYRTTASCSTNGGCSTFDGAIDPVGYQRTDGTPNNIFVGDILAGIINVQNIESGGITSWFASATDQFTGYFAQEVKVVNPLGSDPGDPLQNNFSHLELGTAAADPFGILNVAAGEMFAFYVDDGAGATQFKSNGTTFQDIAVATDGTLWAALGADNGYMYSHVDLTLAIGNLSEQEAFMGLDIVTLGAAYNAGLLALINDINETEIGGLNPGLLCAGLPGVICNQFVGTSEIEVNPDWFALGLGTSPWSIRSNDPITFYREQVPAPGTLVLMGLGLLGVAGMRRKQRRVGG